MPTDDEIFEILRDDFHIPSDGPTPERIAALRRAVLASAAAHAQPSIATVTSLRPARRGAIAIGAAAAIAAAFLVGLNIDDDGPASVARGVIEFDGELVAPQSGSQRAAVRVDRVGIGRIITFDTDDLPILPTGQYYELWFVSPNDSPAKPDRISAGTFHPDDNGRSQVTLVAAVNPALYPILSVTAEPNDGNPSAGGQEVLRATIPS